VLDVMLPDVDGFEVLRRVRADTPDVPVLFLTARDAVEDRVAGLTAGGDDYVTKPFSLEELVARLRGLLRRCRHGGGAPGHLGARRRRPGARRGQRTRCRRGGDLGRADGDRVRAAALPHAQPAPGAVSKAQILDRVWNYDFGGQSNVVELYVSYLRKKIDAGRRPMIHTVRGAGYVLRPAAE
jgi:two-component system OmpR family response regulator